jgi:glutathione S-transferase
MTHHTLYMTHRSPYARKARVAMLEKHILFEEIAIDLQNKPESFTRLSSGATVPILIAPRKLVLEDSTVILHYLEETHPENPLLPKDHNACYEAWNLEEMADRLCDVHVQIYYARINGRERPELLEKGQALLNRYMPVLKERLASQEYLSGSFSIADISFACTMNWMTFRHETNWSVFGSEIHGWLGRVNMRDSFVKTIPIE